MSVSWEKRGAHSREALIKYFTSKGGGDSNLQEALFRVNMNMKQEFTEIVTVQLRM